MGQPQPLSTAAGPGALTRLRSVSALCHCEHFDAESDAVAIERAMELRGADAAELWQQGQMVHSFTAETIEQLS